MKIGYACTPLMIKNKTATKASIIIEAAMYI